MDRKLTKEEIAECKEAFDMFDRNKDGKISTAELTKVLNSLGSQASAEEIRTVIKVYDRNHNGTIEFLEFLKMASENVWITKEEDTEKEIRKAFYAFDKNRDGFISASELKQAMINLGESVTDEEINEMIKEADHNNDSVVSYDEFIKMMK